ncbi:putative RNA methyltransferase [Escherichia coli]|nr:putative RNA methyltransferase [Escherichia coli]
MADARPARMRPESVAEAANTPVALVFGRERVGLTNEELQKCHYHVAIAANPEYSSLNLAMAVQVIAYEVRMAWLATQENGEQVEHEETPYPLVDDLERFYGHLEQTLLATGFIRENHPGQVMNKLRRLFTRARPESQELNILRGILASMSSRIKVTRPNNSRCLMRRVMRLIRPTVNRTVGRIRRSRRIRQPLPDATRNASYQAYSVQNPRADMAFTPHPTTGTNATIKKWH